MRPLDVLVDDLLKVVFLCQADDRLDHLSAFEEQNRRNAADLIHLRHLGIVVDIHLADRDLAQVFGSEGVDRGAETLTGAAPLRPEIHQHWPTRLQHAVIEVAIRKGHHVFGCHRLYWLSPPPAPSPWRLSSSL